MIKILTRKQWNELTETVRRQQETIRQLTGRLDRTQADLGTLKTKEEQTARLAYKQTRRMEKLTKEFEKQRKENRQWQ